jgi:ABC-2 type transport system permease protein
VAAAMRKYLDLYFSFFRASLMADLEYRLNIATKVVTDLLWYAAQASVFEVLFRHAPQISGWDLPAARVFVSVLFLVDAIWMILFAENFDQLSWKVRRGELDLLLVKPVSAQFMITTQKQNTSYVVNAVLTFAWLVWNLSRLATPVAWWKLGLLIGVGLPVAITVTYSFRLMFATLAVVFANAESMNYVWYQLYRLGMRPDPFYPRWLRLLVLTLFPVGFIASVPARILIYDIDWVVLVAGPFVAVTAFLVASALWRRSLKHYASASS